FPNFGLGGQNYNCSPITQGISAGWEDVYSESLDGMWINIPPGTCNGSYWIVAQVDPQNNFLEEDENNNWTAIPFTLTQQAPANSGGTCGITADRDPVLCSGETVTLTCRNAGYS
ncbi:MAG: lysyl oxidase family protein, partial [Planctomyces sp.]